MTYPTRLMHDRPVTRTMVTEIAMHEARLLLGARRLRAVYRESGHTQRARLENVDVRRLMASIVRRANRLIEACSRDPEVRDATP